MRILPRPEDIAEAQGDIRHPVQPLVGEQILLAGQLGGSVGGERTALARLVGRLFALAVDGAAGGGEDDSGAGRSRCLEHVHGADHVHVGVVVGPLDRDAHVGLGREVEADIGAQLGEEVFQRLADIQHVQTSLLVDVLALPT